MNLAPYLRPLAVAVLLVSSWSGAARAQTPVPTFDAFYVFGDSLADNGNVWLTSKLLIGVRQLAPPAPPPSESPYRAYWQGRFSNGPVAFEYLWDRVKKRGSPSLVPYISAPVLGKTGAVNFAFGGTGTPALDQTPAGLWAPGLLGQVALFKAGLRGRAPSSEALYAIVSGANDYRDDEFNTPMSPVAVVGNIVTAVKSLHTLGARNILIVTLPNLGCTPSVNPPGQPSVCDENAQPPATGVPTTLSELSALHNALLARALAEAKLGAGVQLVDVNQVFSELRLGIGALWPVPALETFGLGPAVPNLDPRLAVPMSACLFVAGTPCRDVPLYALGPAAVLNPLAPAFQLLFWDVVHPTTFAHRALAEHIYAQLRR